MALTIVETRAITGGVDTHADVHVAAALDPIGGLLGVREFPATAAGYGRLLSWLGGFGTVCLVGIEGTGGCKRRPGPPHHHGWRPGRRGRPLRPAGPPPPGQVRLTSTPSALPAPPRSGRARGTSRGRDGAVEAIRALMVAKRSAAGERTQTINQARALVLTGPDDLRARFTGHTAAALVAELASLRPRPGSTVGYATRIALRELGRRAEFLDGQLERLDELIGPLVAARAPGLLALFGIGPHTAALLLIAAGDHPERLRSEAALGAPVRRRPHPGILRQDRPPPAQPWRRPAGQPCPVADRVHPPGSDRRPAPPRTPHSGREIQEGNHPLPEALRRPRGLSPPPRHRRLIRTPGAAWPANRLPHLLACEQSAGRPPGHHRPAERSGSPGALLRPGPPQNHGVRLSPHRAQASPSG